MITQPDKMDVFLKKHPVFTVAELDLFLAGKGEFNPGTRSALLTYYRRSGRILPVRRGLYAVTATGSSPDNTPVDPYLLVSRMTPDAILAYHTALEFHGKEYSTYNRFHFLTDGQTLPLKFRSWEFRGVLPPKALRIKKKMQFDVLRAERSGLELRVTGLARTLVDVLDRPDISGTWEEIWRSLESVEFFDLDKVVDYCLLLENSTTAAKVGFFMEQHRNSLMFEDQYFEKLRELRPRQPHYLERSRKSDCRLVSEWNLIVPLHILERSWGRDSMRVSLQYLQTISAESGFRPEILEKVIQLLNLLSALQSHPFLKDRIALKGGTALNLFFFKIPRLSVDIDLNYIGTEDRETMIAERPKVDAALQAVCSREGFTVRHLPDEHAGGKWQMRYDSSFGQSGNLEIDLNFMYRIPLWPVKTMDSHQVGIYQARSIKLLDINELAAGKLVALFSRGQSRDLFDAHGLLTSGQLETKLVRIAFVVYGGINRKDWRMVSVQDLEFNPVDFSNKLVPLLGDPEMQAMEKPAEYGQKLIEECREALLTVLPLNENEKHFLDLLLEKGEIDPTLLTSDAELQGRISRHPAVEWKSWNVRQHHTK